MSLSAIIAEDEPALAQALKAALTRCWPELQVLEVVGDGHAALQSIAECAPDIAFLDIRMPGLSGLQVAEQLLADAAPPPLIVLVTAFNEYAAEAFEREVVDYVVKPVNDQRLRQTVERLKKRLSSARAPNHSVGLAQEELRRALQAIQAAARPALKFLRAGLGDTVTIVPVDEIICLEAQDKYIAIRTAQGEHLIRLSLKELMEQLDPALFVQVHRSTVVNLRAVETAERDFAGRTVLSLRGLKQKVAVSRQYTHLFARM